VARQKKYPALPPSAMNLSCTRHNQASLLLLSFARDFTKLFSQKSGEGTMEESTASEQKAIKKGHVNTDTP
jgi:hypothetical protein